jgi:hypothetical protein
MGPKERVRNHDAMRPQVSFVPDFLPQGIHHWGVALMQDETSVVVVAADSLNQRAGAESGSQIDRLLHRYATSMSQRENLPSFVALDRIITSQLTRMTDRPFLLGIRSLFTNE